MRRGLERRLDRLHARFESDASAAQDRDFALGTRRAIAAAVRAGLTKAGLDPERAAALHRVEQPEPAPAPEAAPTAQSAPHQLLLAKFAALARSDPDMPPPDLANASLAELFAVYCLGDGFARGAPG